MGPLFRGTSHGNQSDIPFVPLFSEMWSQFPSSLEPYTAFRVNLDICHAFFRRHLIRGPCVFADRFYILYRNYYSYPLINSLTLSSLLLYVYTKIQCTKDMCLT